MSWEFIITFKRMIKVKFQNSRTKKKVKWHIFSIYSKDIWWFNWPSRSLKGRIFKDQIYYLNMVLEVNIADLYNWSKTNSKSSLDVRKESEKSVIIIFYYIYSYSSDMVFDRENYKVASSKKISSCNFTESRNAFYAS